MRKIPLAKAFIQAKLGMRRPYLVTWSVTNRCNARCLYCGIEALGGTPELPTSEALELIDLLARSGMVALTFTGGECLLRQDIGQLIARARQHQLIVKINSNGFLVPTKIEEIVGVDEVSLSLDGPVGVHDPVRGGGSFGKVMKATEILRERGVPVIFNVTLSSHNVRSIGDIVGICRERGVPAYFQPAISTKLFDVHDANPVSPDRLEHAQAARELARLKEAGEKLILNSMESLRHLEQWPRPLAIGNCPAGILSFRVDSEGNMTNCARNPKAFLPLREFKGKRVRELPQRQGCKNCWCAQMVELAALNAFCAEAVLNNLRVRLRL